ncbi:IQ domain-containing protein IQM6 [Pistacia vera]|uniref:IQ domain-containing protein IQM6 n=1 Tax=Pistacia vera TaxID=55513 RepID=UPI0012639D98|nr:IQ domain-containing protein IQM6 [Pistacia vera]
MGVSPSYPIDNFDDLDSRFGAVLVRSFSVTGGGGGELKAPFFRSVSFNGREAEPTVRKSNSTGKIIMERSLSFEGRKLDNTLSFKTPPAPAEMELNGVRGRKLQPAGVSKMAGNRRYQAALRLQKVYKSFRTRRKLADCAVLAEQRWWKVLDFAELNRVSFFEIGKHETAISRWSRARTRAAKVGKGLSKDEKARKLALQHWLEAIDPRHRYGHNLQFYYRTWLHCQSKQPFFYWLDIGEGREVNLLERCPRSKLQQQCIKYLGPTERTEYEVVIEGAQFLYKKSGKLLDTTGGPKDAKWIFVLSASKSLYVGQKNKGTFQHSSFLAGGATLSAGRLVVENGILKSVWPHSGHYLPTEENFQAFMSFLHEYGVDTENLQKTPVEEEEEGNIKKSKSLHSTSLEAEIYKYTEATEAKTSAQEDIDSREEDSKAAESSGKLKSKLSRRFGSKVTRVEVPKIGDVYDIFKKDVLPQNCHSEIPESPSEDGYETAEESFLSDEEFMVPKKNLFDEDDDSDDENEKHIPKEKIIMRIDSHKGMRSYQLAQQLSSRWSTGAGPRIGCMRDYPFELQCRVLEQENLSPRARGVRGAFSNPLGRSPLAPEQGESSQPGKE